MRNTPIRKAILELMEKYHHPLSAEELLTRIRANKTTVYRQLDSLTRQGLIQLVRFSDRKLRYEPSDRVHHHHLVCNSCGLIKDIPLNESALINQVNRQSDFRVTSHLLEFFGLCRQCQS